VGFWSPDGASAWGDTVTRRPRVAVLDYGSGNIRSAQRALQRAGADTEVTTDFGTALNADGLVVPGVGAFAACMAGIRAVRGDQIIDRRLAGSRPVLGICVGMQVMFGEFSDRHAIWQALLDRGVLIRETGPPGWLRVTAGTPAEMSAFRDALDAVLTLGLTPAVQPAGEGAR